MLVRLKNLVVLSEAKVAKATTIHPGSFLSLLFYVMITANLITTSEKLPGVYACL
jgi:hypothetical protein